MRFCLWDWPMLFCLTHFSFYMLIYFIRLGDFTYLCSDPLWFNFLKAVLLYLFPRVRRKSRVLIIFIYFFWKRCKDWMGCVISPPYLIANFSSFPRAGEVKSWTSTWKPFHCEYPLWITRIWIELLFIPQWSILKAKERGLWRRSAGSVENGQLASEAVVGATSQPWAEQKRLELPPWTFLVLVV